MAKHTQKFGRQQSTNCLTVFDHFVGLVFKGLISENLLYSLNFETVFMNFPPNSSVIMT